MLRKIIAVARELLEKLLVTKTYYGNAAVISCASKPLKKKELGGGFVIGVFFQGFQNKGIGLGQFSPAATQTEADLDSIYTGLTRFIMMNPGLSSPVVLEHTNKKIQYAITTGFPARGWTAAEAKVVMRKLPLILDLWKNYPAGLQTVVYSRKSTEGLIAVNEIITEG